MTKLTPFHLAVPVHDLQTARDFYGGLLGCTEGRSSDEWVDFNFFGHQVVAHKTASNITAIQDRSDSNRVDGKNVPVPHFGIVMEWQVWQELARHLEDKDVEFIIEPYIRFKGQTGEQATFFVQDPSGNTLEFKAFRDSGKLFAR
jgi:extradiol dioxygenase family protein